MRLVDITGQRFGRLTVVARTENDAFGNTQWVVECDCGESRTVAAGNLRTGRTKSCGCYNRERLAEVDRAVHGHTGKGGYNPSRTYVSWTAMKYRCLTPTANGYRHYGGRGITVCERWLNSFEDFLADMGERPRGKTLDRIDVNGNYEPGNCRWATLSEQQLNKR